ncbi:uncharacterized protein LOC114528078 [Dendronephthya gigantea]|uniref:uncharacterized protein LOC114528078 n=1 Tax=Dendronephthya gigantea TaxID=151771 RepID=UPI00106987FD|nr:uncharacterized protein LOC114528078 [Dendronephthya gigantea]
MDAFVVQILPGESSVNLEVSESNITVIIPVGSDHAHNVRLQRNVGTWSVDLLHNNPGFGKPYLLKLINQKENDTIKISIVPERDFITTTLLKCTFKSLTKFSLNGPNIRVTNSQLDKTFTGVSLHLNSIGTVGISSHPLQVKSLDISVTSSEGVSGRSDVYVNTGALIRCRCLTAYLENGSNVFLNGTVTCPSSSYNLNFRVLSGNLHVSVNGILGKKIQSNCTHLTKDFKTTEINEIEDDNKDISQLPTTTLEQKSETKKSVEESSTIASAVGCKQKDKSCTSCARNTNTETKTLYLEIVNGNLTNFGKIHAKEYLLLLCDNLLLCEASKYDTATRGFLSFTELQKESGYLSNAQQNPKTESSFNDSRLLSTVRNLDSKRFISILNEEVDPTVTVDGFGIYNELKNIFGQGSSVSYDRDKGEKELIRRGFETWKWKHGVISSTSIKCVVKEDLDDCSQLQSNQLILQVEGTARVVKPWTWKCGELSGFVKGNFLFYDNAIITKLNKLCVLGAFRIFQTSTVWVTEGGTVITVEEFENNNIFVSDKSLVLDLGYLKQGRDSSIVSNEDLLVSLHKKVEESWFGNVYVHRNLFIQVEERVVCDAYCVARKVHLEFFGEAPQFVTTQILLAEDSSITMWAENERESANFVVSGKLSACGIKGETASMHVLSGGVAEITCSDEVEVITSSLEVSGETIIRTKPNEDKGTQCTDTRILTTYIYCVKSLVVDGILKVFSSDLNIYIETFKNNGVLKLFTSDHPSGSFQIECDKDVFNSGIIESEGNMIINAMTVSNKNGVIKSSPSLNISTNFPGATTLCGQILADKQLSISSKSKEELNLAIIGGKREDLQYFFPPDHFEVECKEAFLRIESSVLRPEIPDDLLNENNGNRSVVFLSLRRCLIVMKECQLEAVCVTFTQTEDNNDDENPSRFIIQDSIKAKYLYLCAGNAPESDISKKEDILFQGSNNLTVFNTLEVDGSVHEIIFGTENVLSCTEAVLHCEIATIKTDIECIELDAKNLNIEDEGQMKCIGKNDKEMKSSVKVEKTFSVKGSVECVGPVAIFIGGSFVQEEAGSITVEQELLLQTINENGYGYVTLKGSTKGQTESFLNVTSDNIEVSGRLSEVKTLNLNALVNMAFSKESRISCEEIDIKGEWITTAGTICEFQTLNIEPWAIINCGTIDSEIESSDISFKSDLTLINSGICRAQTTYLEAPFLLSLPGESIADVNDVTRCQLVGNKRLKLESIACFLGGSSLRSRTRYENLSVLLFKFLTHVTCTPDSKIVDAWSKAAESLRSIQSQITPDGSKQDSSKLKTLMNSNNLVKGTEVDLRIARMYNMVNDFVEEILKNGIRSFDATKLVYILTIESERYTKINILKEKLLQVPERARKLRQLGKRRVIKLKKSVRQKLGFSDPKMESEQKEGIFESGFFSFGEGVTFTDALYEAAFVEVLCDEGFLFAMDFLASAKDVVMSKREKKAVAMVIYSEKLDMENINADHAHFKTKKAKLTDINTKTLDVSASESVEAENIKGNTVNMESGNIKVSTLDAKNTTLDSSNDVQLRNITSDNLQVQAKNLVATGKIESVVGKIESQGGINLAYKKKNGTLAADHKFNTLQIETRKINDVNKLLKGDGIYADLKICDELGLVVTDQDVIFSRCVVQQNYKLNLDARSVNIENSSLNWKKEASISSDKTINVDHSSISSQKSVSLKSKSGNVGMNSSQIHAGEVAMVEACKGSVKMSGTSTSGDQAVSIKAKGDVIIDPVRKKREERTIQECHKSTIKSGGQVNIKSKRNIKMIGTDCAVQGDMIFDAAETVLLQDRKLSKSEKPHTSRLSFSLEKGLSYGKSHKQMHQEQLAGSKLQQSGGNLVLKGKNVFVKNAMRIDAENLIVDAKNAKFKGAELNNSYSEKSSSVNFGMSFDITNEKSWGKEKKIINQSINVRGKTRFIDCNNVTLTASNLNTGAISGNVKHLAVISKQNEIEAYKQTESVGFVVSGGLPIPSKYGISKSSDRGKYVERSSGIHSRGSINNEFKVGSVHLKGSTVTADGDIAKFADNIISEKVKGYRSQNESGINLGITKISAGFGMHQGEKFMKMEHIATIGSLSGTVASEMKQSVNTDLSEHAKTTQMRNSNLGFNVRGGKDGVATYVQAGDVSVGFSASKQKIGFKGQVGDKKFSVSGGPSGGSLSIQNGQNNFGVGVTNHGVDMNLRSGDNELGASLGKNGFSTTVHKGEFELSASSSKQAKAFGIKAGEFETKLRKETDPTTGKSKLDGKVKVGELEMTGSSSKNKKSFVMKAGEFETELSEEKDSTTGKPKLDGKLKVGELQMTGSSSINKKSFVMKAGEFETELREEKDATTGKPKLDGKLKVGKLQMTGSSSMNKKSFLIKAGEFETELSEEKDATTGKPKLDGKLKVGELQMTGSSSMNKKSLVMKAGEFETELSEEKDSTTGKPKLDGKLKVGELEMTGSSSMNKKSFLMKAGEFETELSEEKDSTTGQPKLYGKLKVGELEMTGSSSMNKKSFLMKAGEFETELSKEKDSTTGKPKLDGKLKVGELEITGSSSMNKKSFLMKAGEFETELSEEKDSTTGKPKLDGKLKVGELQMTGSSSMNKKSFLMKAGEFETELSEEKDSTTGKPKLDGKLKVGELQMTGSSSMNKKSFLMKAGEFETELSEEKDSTTGKPKLDGKLKVGELEITGSSSMNKKSFLMKAGEFETELSEEKDSTTGKPKLDGKLKVGELQMTGSSSMNKKSFLMKAGEFETELSEEKDSTTGKPKLDGKLKVGELQMTGSSSMNKKSFLMKAGEFETELSEEKDSTTGKPKLDGKLKVGELEITGSSSMNKKSFLMKAGEFETELSEEKDSTTGKPKLDGKLKVGELEITGSSSMNKKSFLMKAGEFETELSEEKDSTTGKPKLDGKLKVGELEITGSSSMNKKSFLMKAGEFETELSEEKDSTTGKPKLDGKLKVGELQMTGSSSMNKKSLVMKAGKFETELSEEKDSTTGKPKLDGKLKVGELEMTGSSSMNKKSFLMKAGEFETELSEEKDSTTGQPKLDGKLKVGELEITGSSSMNKKSFLMKAGELETELSEEKDSTTGKPKLDGKLKVGELQMTGSSSMNKKSFLMKAGEFETELSEEKDSTTGKPKLDGKLKVGELEITGSSSMNKKSFLMKAGEFETELSEEKDSTTGKPKLDGKLKVGELEITGSSSMNKKSFLMKAGEFETELSEEKDSTTGKPKLDGKLKVGELEITGSSSVNKKSFLMKAGEFETELSEEKDSTTGKPKLDGKLKVGELEITGSSSMNKKSFLMKAGEFETELSEEKDSTTGKPKLDGKLKIGELEITGSSSMNKKSFLMKAGEFETELSEEKDSTTGKPKLDGKLKVGELEITGLSSMNKKSFLMKAGEFETELSEEKDSTTGKPKLDGKLKVGELEITGSSSMNKKSFLMKAGEFETELSEEKDSTTGKPKLDGKLKVGELQMTGSSSMNKKSFQMKTGEFETELSEEKDSTTEKPKLDGKLKVGKLQMTGSSSMNKKSLVMKAGEFETELSEEKDSTTGKPKLDGKLKVGELEMTGSSSMNKKSFLMKAGEFETELSEEKDSTTGQPKLDGKLKVGELEMTGSSSMNKKSFLMKAGEFETELGKEKDSTTGKPKLDAKLKCGEFEMTGSSSKNTKSLGIKAGEFETELSKEKDSTTGKPKLDGKLKVGELQMTGSSSMNKKSFLMKAGEFETELSEEKDSTTGKPKLDGKNLF